jgi:flavin reductase (DIM6/NTAB) family NADH-FMN oxidoreductase RutF
MRERRVVRVENLSYKARMQEAIEALTQRGAFLTTKVGDMRNTMVIGWGSIGYCWGKPTLTVVVRNSRHTYELLEKGREFTVSIPLTDHLQKELDFYGTNSGRDLDKFSHCPLKTARSQKVEVPIIADCQLHYECEIMAKLRLEPKNLHESCFEWYPEKDYHTFYVGEILACYGTT